MPLGRGSQTVFDTGGDLIEIGDLAKLVVELVNPNAKIHRQIDPGLPSDDYHSDNSDWENLVGVKLLSEDSTREQIARVAF
jgi:hypothetical protein